MYDKAIVKNENNSDLKTPKTDIYAKLVYTNDNMQNQERDR